MKLRKLLSAGIAAVIAASLSVTSYAAYFDEGSGYNMKFSVYNDELYGSEAMLVWVNGKDRKDDKRTIDVNETENFKTAQFQTTGMFTGGTWRVAVTSDEIYTVEKFLKCLDDKCNVYREIQAETKKLATAKISDGVVTVTAGKECGSVCVWVYEVKTNPITKKPEVVIDKEKNIEPTFCFVLVLCASANPIIAYPDDLEKWVDNPAICRTVLKTGKKPLSKLTMTYKVGAEEQESVVLATGDKKAPYDNFLGLYQLGEEGSLVDIKRNYLLDEKGNKIDDGSGGYLLSNEFTVTPKKAKDFTLITYSIEAQKTAKLKVTVIDYYKVTKPDNVVVRYKTKEGYVNVKDGDYVPNKTKLEIYTPLKLNGEDTKDCIYSYTVNKAHVVITYKVGANGEELTVTTTP